MTEIDSITLDINTNIDIEKLERIKNLLAEIKQLHDEIFCKMKIEFKESGGFNK